MPRREGTVGPGGSEILQLAEDDVLDRRDPDLNSLDGHAVSPLERTRVEGVISLHVDVGPECRLLVDEPEMSAERLTDFSLTRVGRIVHHDQDPVFTSYAWTHRLLAKDRCRLSYALGGARDNPCMESFFGRFKTENRSLLQDAETLAELRQVVDDRMKHYNQVRRHSSIAYRAPLDYVRTLLEEGDASQH